MKKEKESKKNNKMFILKLLISFLTGCFILSTFLGTLGVKKYYSNEESSEEIKKYVEGDKKEEVLMDGYYEPVLLDDSLGLFELEEKSVYTDYLMVEKPFDNTQLLYVSKKTESRNEGLSSFRQMSDADWEKIDSIIASETNSNMNRVEKIYAIHNWMVKNIRYDLEYKAHNASETLEQGVAICSGYAALFANFMDAMDIPNQEVWGNARNSSGQTGGHAWNAVQLEDGFYYIVDVTWDDPLWNGLSSDYPDGANMSYDYFLVASCNISYNHFANSLPSPLATTNCNWQSFIGKGIEKKPEPKPDPKTDTTPTPEFEPVPSTNPTPEPDPEPQTDTTPTPEPEPQTDTTPTPEPEPQTDTTPTPEPEPQTDTTPTPEPEPQTDTTPTPEPDNQYFKDPSQGIQERPKDDCGPGEFTPGVLCEDGEIRAENDPNVKGQDDWWIYDDNGDYIINGEFELPDDF